MKPKMATKNRIAKIKIAYRSQKLGGGGGCTIPFVKPTATVKPSPGDTFDAVKFTLSCSASALQSLAVEPETPV